MRKECIIRCTLFAGVLLLTAASQHTHAGDMRPVGRAVAQTDSMPGGHTAGIQWTEFHEDGSIRFSEETTRLFRDAAYRADRYPAVYTAGQVPDLLEAADIPFALWTLMNVHLTQPAQARVIGYKLAAHGIRPEQYLNAFYTYAFTDPEIFHFGEAGGAYLQHPTRIEEKLESCRVLAAFTDKYHQERPGGK